MRKEYYEKKIVELEEELQALRSEVHRLSAEKTVLMSQKEEKLEQMMQGVLAFMQQLYQGGAKTQGLLLRNMAVVNDYLSGATGKRYENLIKATGIDYRPVEDDEDEDL